MSSIEWRLIPDFPAYVISEYGEIRRFLRSRNARGRLGKIMTPFPQHSGHLRIRLRRDKKYVSCFVHRLVALAFCLPRREDQVFVAHNDGNPTNNHVTNLRWATPKENMADKILHGTAQIGERNGRAVLSEGEVRVIRKLKAMGESVDSICNLFGVSKPTVTSICRKSTWKHVA